MDCARERGEIYVYHNELGEKFVAAHELPRVVAFRSMRAIGRSEEPSLVTCVHAS
jgi:hypothetical protein